MEQKAQRGEERRPTDDERMNDDDELRSWGGERLLSFVKLSLHHFIDVLIDGVKIDVYIETSLTSMKTSMKWCGQLQVVLKLPLHV